MRAAPAASSSSRAPDAFLPRLRAAIYGATVLCYLAVGLLHLTALAPLLSALALAAILVSLPATGMITRALSLLFLGTGSWMLIHAGIDLRGYLGAYGQMAHLLALFTVLPVLSVPVRLGGYSKAIGALLRGRISGVMQLNCLVTALAFLCGSFMSLAAVPIMMTSMEPVVESFAIENRKRFIAVSAICGYVLPILWTPVSGVVGVVLMALRLDWLRLFPLLFALSAACLAANWLVFQFLELRNGNQPAPAHAADTPDIAPALRKLARMLIAILALVAGIVLLDRWLHIGLLAAVTVVAIPFALAWCAVIGRGAEAIGEVRAQLALRLPRMADQFAIFLCAGFFSSAMHLSGYDHAANAMFLHLHEALGTRPFLLLMPAMALAAAFLGVHPLVAISLLGASLKPEVLGIDATPLAIALIGSAVLTYMLGPFSGTLGLVQSLNGVSTFRLGLWTLPYALTYVALLAVTLLLL
jgi:hypothetical protein